VDLVIQTALQIGLPLLLLVATYFIGGRVERRHYASIRRRERESLRFPAMTLSTLPASWQVTDSGLVTGSVVVSVDYFKRFLAGLRMIVGGRVKSYESILDRARREAVLRLVEGAGRQGYSAVVNVRIETSRMASAARGGQGVAGLEILAFGTGVALAKPPV
jgi:uncharacterized protein YbjQ (UPF0145 family)